MTTSTACVLSGAAMFIVAIVLIEVFSGGSASVVMAFAGVSLVSLSGWECRK